MGWKDILRPIRDGFRDNFPPRSPKHDDGEVEKRRQQREVDALRGFAYFDSFEDLEEWTSADAAPLQKSNTPRLPRASLETENRREARVVLIHDYAGNYHGYEDCQGSVVSREPYSCQYMQYVDTFVYFSHKLVCVPPPSWTNTLHRNGVRALGTFLVEPQSSDMSSMLAREMRPSEDGQWEYPLATKLADMASTYGFDGWLLNIEKTFPLVKWDEERLVGFISQLSSALGQANVIWYDALTVNNTIRYQNGLTKQNLALFKAAGTILTNYAWTEEKAMAARNLALAQGIDAANIVFGIDVWAQNSQTKDDHARRTYAGGGTGTGIAVGKLAELGLSAGVFAPAWPFEHFSTCTKDVVASMWDGRKLPDSLDCNCVPQNRHMACAYQAHAIISSAKEFPAGSSSFFYTDFRAPFVKHAGSESIHADVCSQSVLPNVSRAAYNHQSLDCMSGPVLCCMLLSNPSRLAVGFDIAVESRRLPENTELSARTFCSSLKIFSLRMKGRMEATVTFIKDATPYDIDMAIIMMGTGRSIEMTSEACQATTASVTLDCSDAEPLTGISIQAKGKLDKVDKVGDRLFPLVEIVKICVKVRGDEYPAVSISNIGISKGIGQNKEGGKLSWCYSDAWSGSYKGSLPYSATTGPFGYFVIHIDDEYVGRSHGLEYVVDGDTTARLSRMDGCLRVKIEGVGFEGSLLCSYTQVLRREEAGWHEADDWQMVGRSED